MSKKNDTDVAHYNFNAHQLILVIFGRDVAERVCYRMVICCPPLLTNVSALPGEMLKCKIASFLSQAVLFQLVAGLIYCIVTHNSCCRCCVAH